MIERDPLVESLFDFRREKCALKKSAILRLHPFRLKTGLETDFL